MSQQNDWNNGKALKDLTKNWFVMPYNNLDLRYDQAFRELLNDIQPGWQEIREIVFQYYNDINHDKVILKYKIRDAKYYRKTGKKNEYATFKVLDLLIDCNGERRMLTIDPVSILEWTML